MRYSLSGADLTLGLGGRLAQVDGVRRGAQHLGDGLAARRPYRAAAPARARRARRRGRCGRSAPALAAERRLAPRWRSAGSGPSSTGSPMPKNGRVAALPPASLRSALSDCTDGSTLSAWLLISQAASRSACVGRRARRRRRRRHQHLQRQAGERAGRHDDEVALAREHAGDRRQHQPVERVRALEVEAPARRRRGCRRRLPRPAAPADRGRCAAPSTCSARTCAPASISAHSARSRVSAHTKLLAEPTRMATSASSALQQRLRLGQPQRLGIGERDVVGEGPDDLGARLSHLALGAVDVVAQRGAARGERRRSRAAPSPPPPCARGWP